MSSNLLSPSKLLSRVWSFRKRSSSFTCVHVCSRVHTWAHEIRQTQHVQYSIFTFKCMQRCTQTCTGISGVKKSIPNLEIRPRALKPTLDAVLVCSWIVAMLNLQSSEYKIWCVCLVTVDLSIYIQILFGIPREISCTLVL